MTDSRQKRRRLRALIAGGRLVVAPGAHNGLSARLVEQAGFPAVYMSGSGVANTLTGGADVGLLSLTEMAQMARFVSQAVEVPVISDADTGYGNAINVMRTVREFEAAGVAGIHIEDQVSPKRCGSVVGKEVIGAAEMVGRIRAAVDARSDPDFLLVARTDARGPLGLDEAIRRGRLYAEAGADMIFPDALLAEEEYGRFAREVPGPKLLNLGGYGRKRTTPKMPFAAIERMGYAVVILPLAALRSGVKAMMDFLADLARDGVEAEKRQIAGLAGHPVENWYEFTGMGDVRALEDAYLPADAVAAKYGAGAGHMPGER
jgi:2-methylisocitrate lyase-like PEP mutase family enzyme